MNSLPYMNQPPHGSKRAFTLIELLVVIAIIALLIGILLPSLASARSAARQIRAAANARSVTQGVAVYAASGKQLFPPHYVYASSTEGTEWNFGDQQISNPNPQNGYVHWSYALFSDGGVGEDAFNNPGMPKGGLPATNPGPDPRNWDSGQINDLGSGVGGVFPNDRQVKRVAFTGNGAIFPRNKFFQAGGERKNELVRDSDIQSPSDVILITEVNPVRNYEAWSVGGVVKSHRPVTPFLGGSSGTQVYLEPLTGGGPRFFYPRLTQILSLDQIPASAIDGTSETELNAVGRIWGGKESGEGGKTNFGYVDGHVETTTLKETIEKKRWGDRFWSITGGDKVNMTTAP